MSYDFSLDLRGESCPYPLVHTLDALEGLDAGQVLLVVTDCPQSFRNIPAGVPDAGHRMLAPPERQGAEMTFLIERGGR